MTMAAGLIVGIVATSSTLFVDAAGSGAVQVQWDRSCPANVEPTIQWKVQAQDLRPVVDPIAATVGGFLPTEQILSSRTVRITNGSESAPFGLLVRDDFRAHISVVAEAGSGVLWIPDTLADRIGATAGSTVTIGPDGSPGPPVVVRGVYRDLTTAPLDHYWCAAGPALITPAITAEYVSPPRGLITHREIRYFADLSRTFSADYIVPFRTAPTNLAEARRARDDTAAFNSRLAAVGPAALSTAVVLDHVPGTPSTTSGIARLEQRAAAVRSAVAAAIRPVALLAIGSGLALASVLGLMWMRVKRNDAVALATLGLGPAAIGSKAALETLLPLVIGAAAGTLVSRGALAIYAPATTLEPGTFLRALGDGVIAAVAAAVLAGATAAVGSRNLLANVAGVHSSRLARVPWELAVVAAAGLSWSGFRAGQLIAVTSARVGHNDVAGVSTSALTFPLLMFVAGALVAARAWVTLLARRRRRNTGFRIPGGLAGRRLRHQSRSGAALVACGTVAIAISVYGAGLVTSLSRTGDAKAGLFVGSDVNFRVGEDLSPDTANATMVLRRMKATYAGIDVDILAIDPTTFTRAAFWDASFDDKSLQSVVDQLTTGADGVASVLAVGDVPSSGALANTQSRPGMLQVRVVETMRVFPGATTNRPFIIVSTDQAANSGFKFSREVWARGTYEHWNRQLIELGVRPFFGITATDAVDSSTLLFAAWAFEFVRALGAFVGLQVVIALLLQIASRQRKQALGFGFLQRMGLHARTHWRALALEVAAYAAAMLVAGIALALAAIRIVGPRLDPLPTSPPQPLLVLPRIGILAAVVVAAMTVLGGTLAAQSIGRRINLAAALRDDS